MKNAAECGLSWIRITYAMVMGAVLFMGGGAAWAVEVGQPAPEFNLPATTGVNISLRDFRGKSWVLVEFYGADFAPT